MRELAYISYDWGCVDPLLIWDTMQVLLKIERLKELLLGLP